MAATPHGGAPHTPRSGDPSRPRYLGLWVAGILLVALFGGAMGTVTDVIYREYESIFKFFGLGG